MPPASSSSFIPKRNPGVKPKRPQVKSVFMLSVVSYALFIAAPLASVGVFIYQLQSQKNSIETLEVLNQAIDSFNVPDYNRLLEFNDRLIATSALVDSHVSIATLFEILSKSTAATVQFESLELTRTDVNTIQVNAALRTSALDGALFQRGQYDAESLIGTTEFKDVVFSSTEPGTGIQTSDQVSPKTVGLKAEFNFSATDIQYTPQSAFALPPAIVPAAEVSPTTDVEASNSSDI
jgi:ABC-type multidrug transport system fused ATPase/permease subunit